MGIQLIRETLKLGKQLRVKRYLVDVTAARYTDTIAAAYELAFSDLQRTENLDIESRVAMIADPKDDSYDFIETVISNAGFGITKFTDQDQGKKFLMERKAPPGTEPSPCTRLSPWPLPT